jgi:hypothetical protein
MESSDSTADTQALGCVINFKIHVSVSINYGSLMQLTGVETEQLRHP